MEINSMLFSDDFYSKDDIDENIEHSDDGFDAYGKKKGEKAKIKKCLINLWKDRKMEILQKKHTNKEEYYD